MPEFVTVATLDELPDGTSKCVTFNGKTVAIFHDQGQFYAIDDLCPHMGASLSAGYVENEMVTCPWHAWRFSICDGSWVENPKLKVDSFQIRVQGQEIQIAEPEVEPERESESDTES